MDLLWKAMGFTTCILLVAVLVSPGVAFVLVMIVGATMFAF